MEHDAWFFIGVFIFIFLVWAATGGPMHSLSFTGPSLAQPAELGGGTYLSLPRAPFQIGSGNVSLPGSSNGVDYSSGSTYSSGNTSLSGSSGGSNQSGATISNSGGLTFGNPSPYKGLVSLSHYVSSAGASDPRNESIQLSVNSGGSVPVDITGWTIESESTGKAMRIPQGTEVPTSGIVNAGQDIILTPGEQAIIISGQSPVGASFRENKCIGYFSSFQTFSPTLPQDCPSPNDELAAFYGTTYIRDAACIDYVNTLSRCQVALSPPVTLSGSCQSFLVKYLNYNGCVAAHQSDADFKGDTWRIYLGRTTAMWRTEHEVVKLLDINGNTVDAFSY